MHRVEEAADALTVTGRLPQRPAQPASHRPSGTHERSHVQGSPAPHLLPLLRADLPACVFQNVLEGTVEEDYFIGGEVQKTQEKLDLQCPISRATITDWDNIEKIWHHSFYQVLHIAPEQHPLMVTEPPLNATSNREKATEILFDNFNVPALYLANQAVLSMYASGQISGTTIESGEGMTYFVPVMDGCSLNQSTLQVDIAGQDLTLYLSQLLSDNGNIFVSTGKCSGPDDDDMDNDDDSVDDDSDLDYIRNVKEKCCYVALDFNMEKMKTDLPSCQQQYQLPDGQEITLGQERFFCPEVLFQPDLIGRSTLGIHMLAFQSAASCESAFHKALFGNMLLLGGTASFSGLQSRMQKELLGLVSPTFTLKVSICPYSIYGTWVGGSILGSLSTFQDVWITRNEYEEVGSSIISRRSF
ncbi:actin [Nycticebus coucang]|uniref:actin n=1 Tax=Nycticebus coucang TaxID=9470 RepID=UPI00234E352C|nr:actin [Nycticebus coucang]